MSLATLFAAARHKRDRAFGRTVTYSPKVFLPVTNLCRNRCDYCSFRRSPRDPGANTMSPHDIENTLAHASSQGCTEALFCLGDKPEGAFRVYADQLRGFGHTNTVAYLRWAGERALAAGLLPHTNAGVLSQDDMVLLRPVNASMGLMLENVSDRLCERGMPHHRAPDKRPARRLRMLAEAGALRIPMTTGILIGIGETQQERIDSLLAIRDLHRKYGHIQEVIVQNFRAHPETPMSAAPEAADYDVAYTVALARLILDDDVSLQAPPNLNPTATALLLDAGLNDWGGISPVTPDFINPQHPWPQVSALAALCAAKEFELRPRLYIYERFAQRDEFVDAGLRHNIRARRSLTHAA